MAYEYIKTLHIIAVISWMVGLLYLPRLYVYHAQTQRGTVQAETFKGHGTAIVESYYDAGDDCWLYLWYLGCWLKIRIF